VEQMNSILLLYYILITKKCSCFFFKDVVKGLNILITSLKCLTYKTKIEQLCL